MARVKRGMMVRKRHNKLLAQAKGFRGNRSRNYKVAHEAVMRRCRWPMSIVAPRSAICAVSGSCVSTLRLRSMA